jgi:hypothetical protein
VSKSRCPPAELNDLMVRFVPDDPVRFRAAPWFGDRRSFCVRTSFAYGRPETPRQPRCPARSCATCERSCSLKLRSPSSKRSNDAWLRSPTPIPGPSRRHGQSSTGLSREDAASTVRGRINESGNLPTKPPAKEIIWPVSSIAADANPPREPVPDGIGREREVKNVVDAI